MAITIESLIQSEIENREFYVSELQRFKAKRSDILMKYPSKLRLEAIDYWIKYWKGWIEISDAKLKLLNRSNGK